VKAAVLTESGVLELVTLPDPRCAEDEVVVQVFACGICGTDRAIFRGEAPASLPLVLGHEFSGTVVEVGSAVSTLSVGQRVAVDPNVVDGACFFCRRGEPNLCSGLSPLGITRNGGFAELSAVPASNAYVLPHGVSLEAGSLVEPLACCVRGIDRAGIRVGDLVVVLGAGPIGCLLIQLAGLQGATTILAVEPDEARRRHALQAGAGMVCEPAETGQVLRSMRSTDGADVVIEATGQTAAAQAALDLVRRGGTLLLFGVYPEQSRLSVSPFRVNENELKIIGSLNNPNTHQRAIDLIASGRIALDGTVTHRLDLSELESAMDRGNFPGSGKVTITFGSEPAHAAEHNGAASC
jgi:2-desacetyl-2-hydroxyethyl bacteriochlorophyllide A dehydrogenase